MARKGPRARRSAKKRARLRGREKKKKAAAEAEHRFRDELRARLEPDGEPAASHLTLLRGEVDSWLAPFDAFDVIASLGVAAYLNRLTDRGVVPQLESYAVEYATVTMLRRSARAPVDQAGQASWDGDLEKLDFLLTRNLVVSRDVETPMPPSSEGLSQAQRHAQFRYMGMQLFGHDPVPPDMELDRLLVLFEPFEELLFERLGFTAVMAGAICASISIVTAEGLASQFGLPAGLDPLDVRERLQERALEGDPAHIGLTVHLGLGREVSFTPADLAAQIGFPTEIVEALFGRLRIGFGDIRDGDPWNQIRRFRRTPLIEDGEDRWLAPVPYDVLYVVRGLVEDELRDAGRLEDFQKRRAQYLEEASRGILVDALRPDLSLRTLSYEHPEKGETKLPEGDGLVVVDRIALILEDKAGGLSPAARGGDPRALAKGFNRLLFDAIAQAERTREALFSGRTVKGVDAETQTIEVDPALISVAVPVAITLEDLSGPSAMLWELMDREPDAVDPADWPWIVNVDDLRWFADELPLACELVHYILVRQRMASAGKLTVGNEADWFRFYRHHGGPRALEILAAAQETGEFHSTVLIVSDARRGRPDPHLPPADLAVAPLLRSLDAARPQGWLRTSIALLDLHPDQGLEAVGGLRDRLRRASEGYVSTATMRPAGDPDLALTIRIGSLDTGPHLRDGALVEPGADRRVVIALDGSSENLQVACRSV